jgi:serine/threonine protein kinase
MTDPDRLLALAAVAAEGSRVDWEREAGVSGDESERRVVRALGLLASVLAELRGLHGPAASPDLRGRWGPLEVLDEIGEGSSCRVYRARDPRLDRIVALKLRPADAASAERIVSEGRLMARVRHPNVVTVHGADVHDGMVGIWMELGEGPSLADHVREKGVMSASETIAVGIDLCAASSTAT